MFPWRLVWAISFVQATETIFVRFLNSPVERDTVLALYRMQCKDISTGDCKIALALSVVLVLVLSSLVSTLLPSKTSTTMNCDWLC